MKAKVGYGDFQHSSMDKIWELSVKNLAKRHHTIRPRWTITHPVCVVTHLFECYSPQNQCTLPLGGHSGTVFTRSTPMEEIKGQTLRLWELPSECSCVIIICKPGLNCGAMLWVNEQKREEKDRGITTSLHLLGFTWDKVCSPYWKKVEWFKLHQSTSRCVSHETWLILKEIMRIKWLFRPIGTMFCLF